MTRGERIAYAIEQSGQTPAGVARIIGCSSAAIYQWINGITKDVKNDLLFALADATGFEARWIGTGKGPERPDGGKAKKLLDLYRQLDERGQAAVFRVAQSESAFSIDGECDDCEHCQRKSA